MSSLLLLLLLSAIIPVQAQDPDLDKFTQETREIVSNFTASLIRRCEIEIESIGLHAATEICRITAPQVYYEYSVKHKIILNLVSLTPRNVVTGHADVWEQAGLLKIQKMTNIDQTSKIEIVELVQEPAATYYRYMSPLFATSFCLKCHGKKTELDRGISSSIEFLYPEDKAMGYALGDLMGAISIKKRYTPRP
ncbi:DUF3365 domain-containing protein [bacterium]|nr:DUF3365 domain-containing protein [bacterium]